MRAKERCGDVKLLPFNVGCARLGYHPQHVRRLISQGKLKPPVRLHPKGRPYLTEKYIADAISSASKPRWRTSERCRHQKETKPLPMGAARGFWKMITLAS